MKVTFISHASILIETKGLRILSDPWWAGPCFGAQWWLYPDAYLEAVQSAPVDYIYISHGHHDHFHPGTLAKLPKTSKMIVAREIALASPLRDLGFSVHELDPDKEFDLGKGVRCRVMPTYSDDTLMVTTDGEETVVNLNDALHATPLEVQDKFFALLKSAYPKIDYLFCGYGTASHFPNCYFIPGKDPEKTAVKRQHYFNLAWTRIVDGLQPKFAFPFAADVVLLEKELFPLNEAIHNTERPTDLYRQLHPDSTVQVFDIAPGFSIDSGKPGADHQRRRISNSALQSECPDKIEKANQYKPVESAEIRQVADLVTENIRICNDYLKTFPGNYRCLIQFRNAKESIDISKRGDTLTTTVVPADSRPKSDYDVIFTTRLSYLRQSLVNDFGHEIIFVGSGGIFEYPDASKVPTAVHRELVHIVQRHTQCPKPRFGGSSHLVYQSKQFVKNLLGMTDEDLYDLQKWTVFRT